MPMLSFLTRTIGTYQLCFVHLMSSLQSLGVFCLPLAGTEWSSIFLSLRLKLLILNNPQRDAMNLSFVFTCDETTDRRDTIICFHFADSILIIDFFTSFKFILYKSNIFPILDLSFKKIL